MIDRQARNMLAGQIRHFLVGLSDNFKFDKIVFDIRTRDNSVKEIRRQMWYTYDDLTRHKLKGKWTPTEEGKDIVKRFILFLKTDLECERPNKSTDWNLWPFSDNQQYEMAKAEPRYLNDAT